MFPGQVKGAGKGRAHFSSPSERRPPIRRCRRNCVPAAVKTEYGTPQLSDLGRGSSGGGLPYGADKVQNGWRHAGATRGKVLQIAGKEEAVPPPPPLTIAQLLYEAWRSTESACLTLQKAYSLAKEL